MKIDINGTSDSEVTVTIKMTADEFAHFQESLPEKMTTPEAAKGAEILGFLPKAHYYCVKVRNQDYPSFYCQTTIYESPLWAWARAVGIGVRKAGLRANVEMSTDRCVGDQDSCQVS